MDEQILPYKIRIESTSQSSQTKPTLTFSALPEELYHELLLWLDWKDMLIMEQLNHSWLFRASNRFYWKRFCELLLNVELLDDIDSQYNWKIIFKELYFQKASETIPAFARLRPIQNPQSCIVLSTDRLQILNACKEFPSNQVAMATIPYLWASYQKFDLEAVRVPVSEYSTNKSSEDIIKYRLCKRNVRYYELTIQSKENNTSTRSSELGESVLEKCVAIGLAPNNFPEVGVMPGWIYGSYGYHSDDGKIFHGNVGRKYGPTFATFDKTTISNEQNSQHSQQQKQQDTKRPHQTCTVGCGLHLTRRCIFFTLNGKFLGIAFQNVLSFYDLYPTIGLDTEDLVTCNFGMKPFVFNLSTIEQLLECENEPSKLKTASEDDISDTSGSDMENDDFDNNNTED